LLLERLQPTGLGHVHAAEPGFPVVESRPADPVLAADLCRLHAGFLLPQDPDDLLFREPRSLHRPPPSMGGLYSNLAEVQGLRSRSPNVGPIDVAVLTNLDGRNWWNLPIRVGIEIKLRQDRMSWLGRLIEGHCGKLSRYAEQCQGRDF